MSASARSTWSTSYSLLAEQTAPWFASVDPRWATVRARTLQLLQRDRELREIAGLIGPEALQDTDRLVPPKLCSHRCTAVQPPGPSK